MCLNIYNGIERVLCLAQFMKGVRGRPQLVDLGDYLYKEEGTRAGNRIQASQDC
jgi:hypothetical protein